MYMCAGMQLLLLWTSPHSTDHLSAFRECYTEKKREKEREERGRERRICLSLSRFLCTLSRLVRETEKDHNFCRFHRCNSSILAQTRASGSYVNMNHKIEPMKCCSPPSVWVTEIGHTCERSEPGVRGACISRRWYEDHTDCTDGAVAVTYYEVVYCKQCSARSK